MLQTSFIRILQQSGAENGVNLDRCSNHIARDSVEPFTLDFRQDLWLIHLATLQKDRISRCAHHHTAHRECLTMVLYAFSVSSRSLRAKTSFNWRSLRT